LGIPVICLDHCGQADVINDTCGIKIPVITPKQSIADISKAIICLAENPYLRSSLSKKAKQRVLDFSWEKKTEVMVRIYENAVTNWQNEKNTARL
jgi:glycosyltransferase involved in cell wall biosynthesis